MVCSEVIHYEGPAVGVAGGVLGVEAAALRTAVEQGLKSEFDTIYIDFKKLTDSGLPAVNEVIHAHYTLAEAAKKLVLVYIKGGAIEKWALNVAKEHGFREVGHTAEIFGLCAKC